MNYTLDTLPANLLQQFLQGYQLSARAIKNYRVALQNNSSSTTLPELTAESVVTAPLLWATADYNAFGCSFSDTIESTEDLPAVLKTILPRKDKSLALQRSRTEGKAEVFTPSWLCNLQNNAVDDHTVGTGAFNTVSNDGQSWTPSAEKIFKNKQEAIAYIIAPRLELTCGEAPYLVSRYDTVTGEDIPVRDSEGRFQRGGLLDRKLRVAAELAKKDYYTWELLALEALKSTYGYEWQGDSLLLARLNVLNSFLDYRADFLRQVSKTQLGLISIEPSTELLAAVAEAICWNLWQMDGVSMTTPGSCTTGCVACSSKSKEPLQKYWGHDGALPVIRMKGRLLPFESLVYCGAI